MIQKIPFSSIKDENIDDLIKKKITCNQCKGVLYEPVISLKNNLLYCKDCILEVNNIDKDTTKKDLHLPYKQCNLEIKKLLNTFTYSCPNYCKNEKDEDILFTYDFLVNHLIDCPNLNIKCCNSLCDNNILLKKIQNKEEISKLLIKIKILERELEYQRLRVMDMKKEKENNKKVKQKNEKETNKKVHKSSNNVREEIPIIEKKNSFKARPVLLFKNPILKEKPKINPKILDNSKVTTLFDKCPHFYGNYKPLFSCCGKVYGCYLCHNEKENHPYQFSNKVQCLFCNTFYPGKSCPKCKANQLFKRK